MKSDIMFQRIFIKIKKLYSEFYIINYEIYNIINLNTSYQDNVTAYLNLIIFKHRIKKFVFRELLN